MGTTNSSNTCGQCEKVDQIPAGVYSSEGHSGSRGERPVGATAINVIKLVKCRYFFWFMLCRGFTLSFSPTRDQNIRSTLQSMDNRLFNCDPELHP